MRRRLLLMATATALVLSGCVSGGSDEPDDGSSGTLRIALAGLETEQFDPHVVSQTTKIYQSLMYDWLVGATPEGEFDDASGVATDWTYSEDGLTWTATIRDGITFWDGTPLTAEDAAFSLARVVSEEGSSSGASTLRGVIDSVEVVDGDRIEVSLSRPFQFLPHLLSRLGATDGAVIPKAYFEQVGADGFAAEPMGSGPYRLAEYNPGASMVFERVENHWRVGTPRYERIEFLAVPEEQTRLALLQRGEAELVAVSRQGAVEAENLGFTVLEKPNNANVHVNYHEQWVESNPLSDERVREAMNLAINRQEIVDSILYGRATIPGIGHLGSEHIGWDESIVPPYPYDPDRARQLLAESGYLDDPKQIDVYSYERAEAPEIPQIMEALTGYWEAVGLNVRLIRSEYGAVREQWGNFTLGSAVSVLGTANRVVFPVQLVWGTEGALTYARDPELDDLIAAWSNAPTVDEAVAAIQAVMRYVHDHHISGPVVSVGSVYASDGIEEWPGLTGLHSGEIHLDGLFAS
jgi:peptide/nickel transport system substrate-binding protein